MTKGILYIVGTPIGNLGDMTLRGIETLKKVDWIAAEDTRHTGKLLQHFEIATPQISYHDHNRTSRQQQLLALLLQGKAIALVTDAGMPGISDPGYELVEAAIAQGIQVVPIPGVTAVITALVGSGLKGERFVFEGFLPIKSAQRLEHLRKLVYETRTLIFYEAPHRLRETIEDMAVVFGEGRSLAVCRELTKLYEDFWRGTLGEAQLFYSNYHPKGEYTLVVEGAPQSEDLVLSPEAIKQELKQLLQQGLTLSQASKQLAAITNLGKREVYQIGLELEV